MGATYILVNYSREETVDFLSIGASKAKELAGNPVAAAITTWYLLKNRGDRIAFVSDSDPKATWDEIAAFPDVTGQVVESLIQAGIVEDRGIAWTDEEDPDSLYVRDLRNIWAEQFPGLVHPWPGG